MGVFLLLPSLLSTVISHHGTPSRWIPSSLRQCHSPLSLSLSLKLSTRSLSSAAGMKLTLFFPALRAESTAFCGAADMTSTHCLPPPYSITWFGPSAYIIFRNTTTRSQLFTHAQTQISTRWPSGSKQVTVSQRLTGGNKRTRLLSITCLQASRSGRPDHN